MKEYKDIVDMKNEAPPPSLYDLTNPKVRQVLIEATPCFGKGVKTDPMCQGCLFRVDCMGEKEEIKEARKEKRMAIKDIVEEATKLGFDVKKVRPPRRVDLINITPVEVKCDVPCVITGKNIKLGQEGVIIFEWGWVRPDALDLYLQYLEVK